MTELQDVYHEGFIERILREKISGSDRNKLIAGFSFYFYD